VLAPQEQCDAFNARVKPGDKVTVDEQCGHHRDAKTVSQAFVFDDKAFVRIEYAGYPYCHWPALAENVKPLPRENGDYCPPGYVAALIDWVNRPLFTRHPEPDPVVYRCDPGVYGECGPFGEPVKAKDAAPLAESNADKDRLTAAARTTLDDAALDRIEKAIGPNLHTNRFLSIRKTDQEDRNALAQLRREHAELKSSEKLVMDAYEEEQRESLRLATKVEQLEAEIADRIKATARPSTLDALASMLPIGLSKIGLSVEKTADGVAFTIESIERVKP
jgi:hypothetical protein